MKAYVSGGRYPSGNPFREGPTMNPDDVVASVEPDGAGRLRVRLDDRTHEDMWIEIVIETRSELMETIGASNDGVSGEA